MHVRLYILQGWEGRSKAMESAARVAEELARSLTTDSLTFVKELKATTTTTTARTFYVLYIRYESVECKTLRSIIINTLKSK